MHTIEMIVLFLSRPNRSNKQRNPTQLEAVFCRNSFCTRGLQKAFGTESAFQKHLAMLPQCKTFLMNQHAGQGSHYHTISAMQQMPSFPNKVIIATSNKGKYIGYVAMW
jgi:hypothetical protein